MLEKIKIHSHQIWSLRPAFSTILQFKLDNFPLTLVLPFCQYCDRKILGKLAWIYLKNNFDFYLCVDKNTDSELQIISMQ